MFGLTKDDATDHAAKTDHELFLQAFETPTQICKYVSLRHRVNPLFLHRNLLYMKHRNSRRHINRCRKVNTIVSKLSKNAPLATRESNTKISITGIDNKDNSTKVLETYEVQMHIHKASNKRRNKDPEPSEDAKSKLSTIKFTVNDKKSQQYTTTIRGSTINKFTSGKGCTLEFRVKLRSAKSPLNKKSPPKKRQCVEEWYSAEMLLQGDTSLSRDNTMISDASYILYLYPMSLFQEDWLPSQICWESIGSTPEEDLVNSEGLALCDEVESLSSISFDLTTDNREERRVKEKRKVPVCVDDEKTDKVALLYNFLYNGSTQQQTECRRNMVCPWCALDCREIYPLLEHITCCHPRFKVTYIPGLNGFQELDIEINEIIMLSDSPDEEEGYTFSGPNRRAPFSLEMRRGKIIRTEKDFMTLDVAPYPAPHNRLYFHSTSYEPILPSEVDYDSDNEQNMSWIKDKTKQLIQDFTDVNEGEKEIMILWNCFILPVRPLADYKVPDLVHEFSRQQGHVIIKRGLVHNFLLHLTNLHSFGLLSPCHIEKVMEYVYSLQNNK